MCMLITNLNKVVILYSTYFINFIDNILSY